MTQFPPAWLQKQLKPISGSDMSAAVVTLTPDQAEELLDAAEPDRERPLQYPRVFEQIRRIDTGEWQPFNGESIKFTASGKRADGQHRLHAIAKGDHSVKILIVCGCDNEAFKTIDTGKSRSLSDLLKLYGMSEYTTGVSATISAFLAFDDESGSWQKPRGGLSLDRAIQTLEQYPMIPDVVRRFYGKGRQFHFPYSVASACYVRMAEAENADIMEKAVLANAFWTYALSLDGAWMGDGEIPPVLKMFRQQVFNKSIPGGGPSGGHTQRKWVGLSAKTWHIWHRGDFCSQLVFREKTEKIQSFDLPEWRK